MNEIIRAEATCPSCKERFILRSGSSILKLFYELEEFLTEVRAHVKECKIKTNPQEASCPKEK